jgi:glycosyltransferase involved in cell wall biosynthesis
MTPLISIIVPVYNVSQYLSQCIESVLAQTYENFELILIDDGSTDGSGKICDEYAEKDIRLKVEHQHNLGVSATRNRGIQLSRGSYLTFIDADDWVETNYLEILFSNMHEFGLSVCKFTINNNSNMKEDNILKLDRRESYLSICNSRGMGGFCCGKLFDKRLIDKEYIKFDSTIGICEDLIFVSHYLSICNVPVLFDQKQLYHYRINPQGTMLGRYKLRGKIASKDLSEFDGCIKASGYAEKDSQIQKAFMMRITKGACNTLRTMVSNNYTDNILYEKCLQYVRRHFFNFLFNNDNLFTTKISIMLCAFNPKLEFLIYKFIKL